MKIAPVLDVKASFQKYMDKIKNGPIIITRNGRPAAILLSAPQNEEELERFILAYSPKFRQLIDVAYSRIRKGRGVKHTDFWKVVQQ